MTNRTIRLFVSSTFSDFKAERDLLQREVFPKLQRLCLSKGLRFQAIDLRWGVPEEAGKDNRTMRICLRELKRCQEGAIKPNFLVLLGDRYGWRPLPETIQAEVFEEIERELTAKRAESAKILETWYRRDDNAVPAEYVLQPRTGRFEDFAVWSEEVELPLLAALAQYSGGYEPAAAREQQAHSACCTGIGLSATHQEIIHGALALPEADARKQIHAHVKNNFLRYLAFQDVASRAGSSATPDAWLAWIENQFLYAGGCGVDSVSALIFPAFFFSSLKFERLLRYEPDYFRRVWSTLRAEIALLYPLYTKHDLMGLKKHFALIFKKISDLNLLHAEGIESAQDGGTPPPFLNPAAEDPFAPPSNVFTREHLVLDEAAAPIEFERLGGGNPAALQQMIERNTAYITLLRRLHAQPAVIQPRQRGWFANGIDFDMARLEALMVGVSESPFAGIDYRPAPRPDVRYTVRILVDFSGSMGSERVGLAKDFALALSLGLRNFDVVLYFYSTKGSFYQLIEVFDSRRRKLGGLAALASICDKKYDSGWGWNPDAACLLAVNAIMAREPGITGKQNILIYLGDMEFCSSLKVGIADNAVTEVAYAVRKLLADGHRLIIGRCGTDFDPFPPDEIPHGYFHMSDTGIDHPAVRELYRLIVTQVSSIER